MKIMDTICYNPIGIIHTPFKELDGMPIQPIGAVGIKGTIELKEEFVGGLQDLDGFSHIILIYHFHLAKGFSLKVIPFMDNEQHGIFSTRAPKRPNPIGISVVRLTKIKGNTLHVENTDILDGTPLLDIKPFVPEFDAPEVDRIGWLGGAQNKAANIRADERFK